MKVPLLLPILLISFSLQTFAQAQAALEFTRLQQQQEQAERAALEPLRRRYNDSLQALLHRATTAGDLETAAKIREELQRNGTLSASPINAENRLVDSKWVFPLAVNEPTHEQYIQFADNGVLIVGWNLSIKGKWSTNPDGTILLRPFVDPNRIVTLRIDATRRAGTLTDGAGKESKTKHLR